MNVESRHYEISVYLLYEKNGMRITNDQMDILYFAFIQSINLFYLHSTEFWSQSLDSGWYLARYQVD